jgi:PEP-CTERM motif
LATVTNQILEGYNNGNWNGPGGIVSSAAANTAHLTALGVIQNNNLFNASNLFDNTAPGTNDILVKYTYYGDANLSGNVDGSDYGLIDNGYLMKLTGWYNGDFNYDGYVNGSDYTLIDNAYNMQGTAINAEIAVSTSQIAGPAAVPEPGSSALIAIASVALLSRRRRQKMTQLS